MRWKVLLLVVLASAATTFFIFSKRTTPSYVIVILLDTLRADHLSSYGHHHSTSPNLDAFGSRHLVYANAFSTAPWTPPSVASLFTGLYSAAHGMTPSKDKILARETGFQLSTAHRTMAELFHEAGYKTTAISANPWIASEFGFDQGFDSFAVLRKGTAQMVTDAAISSLNASLETDDPLFLYLQYIDPHHPYKPPAQYRDMFPAKNRDALLERGVQKKIRLYDGEIRYLDEHLGRLFTYLQERGIYNDTTIVVTADHGEQFMDHGELGHGLKLFNSETHVPLYLKLNRAVNSARVEVSVSVADILPTVLELSGIEIPKNLSGVSLLNRKELDSRDGVLSEVSRTYFQRSFVGSDGRKLIMEASDEQQLQAGKLSVVGLFDTIKEPAELVALDEPHRTEELKNAMEQAVARSVAKRPKESAAPQSTMSSESLEQLKSLGYLQ